MSDEAPGVPGTLSADAAAPGEDSGGARAAEPGPTQEHAAALSRHELRTPVHHILGSTEMLLEEAEDSDQGGYVAELEAIHAAGQQVLTLVEELGAPGARDPRTAEWAQRRDKLGALLAAILAHSATLQGKATAVEDTALAADLEPIDAAAHRLLALVDGASPRPAPPPVPAPPPAALAAPVPSPAALAVPAPSPAPKRPPVRRASRQLSADASVVLVVDDNAVNRKTLARRLEHLGYAVRTAENGRRALEVLRATNVDLVLLDVLMPVMNGYQVLEERRADAHLSDIPVIMLSALDEVDSVVRCIEMGAADYLPKPFNPVLLRARIGACLERKRLRDQELEYLRQVEKVTAAAASLEAGTFEPASLADVAARPDKLGGLARGFNSMVVALEAAHQAEVKTEVVRHELSRAREIQERLLPEHLAAWPGLLELAVRFRAAREMSGDFYDVFELTKSTPTDDPPAERAPLQIAVGDVAGKSIPAALVMALARTTLRAVVQQVMDVRARRTAVAEGPPQQRGDVVMAPVEPLAIPSPAVTMRLTGGVLHRDVGRRDFVACALALVEPAEADEPGPRLRLVNAGQVPPILCRDGGAEELEPPGDRLPLGILPDPQYEDLLVNLRPGDVIVFASDGLPEAPLSSRDAPPSATHYAPPEEPGEMFGFERLAASSAYWTTHAADAEEVAAGVWADVNDWSGDASDHDDMTLVVLRVLDG